MKTSFLFFSLAISLSARSQAVSGLYTGTLYNDTTKLLQNYQLALSEYKGKITGYSYTTFVINDTFYYGIRSIKASVKADKLIVEEDKMIVNNFPEVPAKGVRRLTVIPISAKQDTLSSLSGRWETNRTKKWLPVTGSIQVARDNDSANSALIGHLKELQLIGVADQPAIAIAKVPEVVSKAPVAIGNGKKVPVKSEPVKINTPPVVPAAATTLSYTERKSKVMETIVCTGDSLLLSFYDNGVVDGDVISVYVNGTNIISSVRLTESALRRTIVFNAANGLLEVKLVAENMGTLPPNTGLLIVQDGTNKYNLNFSADMQTNASIIFSKKK
jgi:hypothetical protein